MTAREMSTDLKAAVADWACNRSYVQNGHFRIKTKTGRGPIAPYNKALHREGVTCSTLSALVAKCSEQLTPLFIDFTWMAFAVRGASVPQHELSAAFNEWGVRLLGLRR